MASVLKEALTAKVIEIAQRVGASQNIEIVDVEMLGGGIHRVLRVFIDKPAGVTHADCELVSHGMSAILDEEDVIPGGTYHLEVSSPGVERRLKTVRDFERFQGQKVKVQLRTPIENRRRWEGTLTGIANNVVDLEASPGRQIQFPLDDVEQANLKFEW